MEDSGQVGVKGAVEDGGDFLTQRSQRAQRTTGPMFARFVEGANRAGRFARRRRARLRRVNLEFAFEGVVEDGGTLGKTRKPNVEIRKTIVTADRRRVRSGGTPISNPDRESGQVEGGAGMAIKCCNDET